jgi:hypothetical protein
MASTEARRDSELVTRSGFLCQREIAQSRRIRQDELGWEGSHVAEFMGRPSPHDHVIAGRQLMLRAIGCALDVAGDDVDRFLAIVVEVRFGGASGREGHPRERELGTVSDLDPGEPVDDSPRILVLDGCGHGALRFVLVGQLQYGLSV